MKKAQWQFTHRPGNQADIRRILREARADGLTLVEVRGGPHQTRGVYIDAEFVAKHKEHWPKNHIRPPEPDSHLEGWDGNWVVFAGARKQEHAEFLKNLEAASSKPEKREYPPTVSVRAVGPGEAPAQRLPKPGEWFKVSGYLPERSVFRPTGHKFDRERDGQTFQCKWVDKPSECDVTADAIERYGNCIQTTEERVNFRTKEWERIEIVEAPAPEQPYIPKVGDWFTAAVKPSAEMQGLSDVRLNPHKQVFVCAWNDGDGRIGVRRVEDGITRTTAFNIAAAAYEFRKVEQYIPKPGDWFTAKAISSNAIEKIIEDPHGQTLICLDDNGEWLRVKFFGGDRGSISITKRYYEFQKREKL